MKLASLSARITTLLVITSLLVLGGGARWMDWRIDHEMESRFQQNLLTQASTLSTMVQLEQDDPSAYSSWHPHGGLAGDSPSYYELRCDGAPPRHSTPPPPVFPADWPLHTDHTPRFTQLHHAGQSLGAVQLAFPSRAGQDGEKHPPAPAGNRRAAGNCVLLFEQDRQASDEFLLAIDWILLLSPTLALGIALVAVPLIVRRGLRPVAALVERMRDIGPNAPGQRLAASGMRELDPLVNRFNDVLERMDDGLARERQFASGLAHETRTRLAELRTLTEVESRYPSRRRLPQILGEVGSIGAELEATVSALLLLTRLQSGLEQPQWQPLPMASWVERQLHRQQGLASHRHVTLTLAGTPPARLRTDPALLEVIVANLLGNACTYAPAGSTVAMRLGADGLSIDNPAPDLDQHDLTSFGERFWRKQPPHAGHAGLGLALAAAAARALDLHLRFRLDGEQRLHAELAWPRRMTRENEA